MANPPTKKRRAKRTEEERIDYLRNDPYVAQFEPYRVLCGSCNKWIRLRPNSTYCSIPWDAHRKSCLSKKAWGSWFLFFSPLISALYLFYSVLSVHLRWFFWFWEHFPFLCFSYLKHFVGEFRFTFWPGTCVSCNVSSPVMAFSGPGLPGSHTKYLFLSHLCFNLIFTFLAYFVAVRPPYCPSVRYANARTAGTADSRAIKLFGEPEVRLFDTDRIMCAHICDI